MKIGFTGTQIGMNNWQKEKFKQLLESYKIEEFHHGQCVGADKDAHDIAQPLSVKVIIHPPVNKSKVSECNGENVIMLPDKQYLDRNHDIVDACDILIATPKGKEEVRSGTWATIRYAKKTRKSIRIIFPINIIEEYEKGVLKNKKPLW